MNTSAEIASHPTNLQFSLTSSTTNDGVAVMVEWDPPLDDGGVNVTSLNYQIFVDSVLEDVSNDTEAILELNTTREHLVQVRAINCAGYGANISSYINITGTVITMCHFVPGIIFSVSPLQKMA